LAGEGLPGASRGIGPGIKVEAGGCQEGRCFLPQLAEVIPAAAATGDGDQLKPWLVVQSLSQPD